MLELILSLPNCPYSFEPHEKTDPSLSTATEKSQPHDTLLTVDAKE